MLGIICGVCTQNPCIPRGAEGSTGWGAWRWALLCWLWLGEVSGAGQPTLGALPCAGPAALSCRYLKYLTKKYLKKNNLRDWLRVVANSKESYELRYFQINQDEEEEEEED